MSRYIDAEWLIRELSIVSARPISTALDIIKSAPAADVAEVRHGRWDRKYRANFMCSVCKYWVITTDEYGNRIDSDMDDYTYCPKCGSRMDLDDEVEE